MAQHDKEMIELLSGNEPRISISAETLARSIHENRSRRRLSKLRMVNAVILTCVAGIMSFCWVYFSTDEVPSGVSVANKSSDSVSDVKTQTHADDVGDYLRQRKLAELRQSLSELRSLEQHQNKVLIKERISRTAIKLPTGFYDY